jgi:dTMP kinase
MAKKTRVVFSWMYLTTIYGRRWKMIREIEGIDGAGKTSQCQLLKEWFETRGRAAVIVKDLESTDLGRKLKELLAFGKPKTKEVELLAFLACKAQLCQEVIREELPKGTEIICDRGVGSFLSYFLLQGFERAFLDKFLSLVLPGIYIAQTILIDTPVLLAMQRKSVKPMLSKFDEMGAPFFTQQRAVYLDLAYNEGWTIVGGSGSIEAVHAEIVTAVEEKL